MASETTSDVLNPAFIQVGKADTPGRFRSRPEPKKDEPPKPKATSKAKSAPRLAPEPKDELTDKPKDAPKDEG